MAQNLTTNIVINAKTGNGFSKVGQTLTEMGSIVNELSQQLISFGEESVQVYRTYEKSMRDAEVALSTTYGRGTKQLQTVMDQLDTAATNWAASTIFHTDDVANAISEAAHAGWDLEEIMSGIPAAMQLAQAGSLDLSEALNYIVKSTYAAGIEFDDLAHFTDIWTYSANSSATTIGEVGDAMLRMGSTMRFAANPEELMTLISVMANSGFVGSEAGTLIRNSMMRLIAPTDKANKALSAMGATAEELQEIAGDENITAAYETLVEHGFRGLYDEQGNMRNILDVYSEMAVILGDMAGGMDKISENEEALKVLSSIFPVRSITGALNLLNAAADNYGDLYDKMMAGEAEGYGEYGAETMMDTLNGKILIFESKAERLKQVVGEELKPLVENLADFGGNIIDGIAEMDPEKLSMLVDGMTAIAAIGPGLLAAGGAFRLIGMLANPVGLGAVAVTSALTSAYVLYEKSQRDYAANFGNMALDTGEVLDYVNGIGEGLRSAYKEFDEFKRAVDDAAKAYETASSSLSGKLLTNMLTKKELSSEDKEELYRLADDMYEALTDGIENRNSATISYWRALFGDVEDIENDPVFQQIMEITNKSMTEAATQAEGLSQQLRNALTSAFADGEISEDEYNNILNLMRSYNDALAQAAADAQSEEDFVRMSMWQHKAQTASFDEIQDITDTVISERDSILADRENEYLEERFRLEYRGADQELLDALDEKYADERAKVNASYDDFLYTLWDSQLTQSDMGENYAWLNEIAEQYRAGMLSDREAYDAINDMLGTNFYAEGGLWNKGSDASKLYSAIHAAVNAYGGTDALMSMIEAYEKSGELGKSDKLRTLLAADRLLALSPNMFGGGFAENEARTFVQGDSSDLAKGWASGAAEGAISGLAGATITVDANTDLAQEAIDDLNGQIVSVTIVPGGEYHSGGGFSGRGGKFAEGGRATEASIFGEAGAEWAIPEEHSERTAELLNAARAASGFTWPDLLARFGGMNANADNRPTTIVYSPVIHAANASGVEAALWEDKQRLDKWWSERKMRDAVEVYA